MKVKATSKKATKQSKKGKIAGLPVESGQTIAGLLGDDAKPRKARKAKGKAGKAVVPALGISHTLKSVEALAQPEKPEPVTYRVIHLPAALWGDMVEVARTRKGSTRQIIREAIDADLFVVVKELQAVGMGVAQVEKRIRSSLDRTILAALAKAKQETGVPAITLLRLVLEHYVARKQS